MTTFLNPYNPFLNPRTGAAITHGRIYIGLPFTDPTQERNQVPVTSTTRNIDAMEQRAIVQPIRILNGLLVDRTLPISINLEGSHFSIAVFDNNGIEIFYASSIQYDSSADNNDRTGFVSVEDDVSLGEFSPRFFYAHYAIYAGVPQS